MLRTGRESGKLARPLHSSLCSLCVWLRARTVDAASSPADGDTSTAKESSPAASTSMHKPKAEPLPQRTIMLRRCNECKVDALLQINVELYRVCAAILAQPTANAQLEMQL